MSATATGRSKKNKLKERAKDPLKIYGLLGWTKADEYDRIIQNQRREGELKRIAEKGRQDAIDRIQNEKYQLWFGMQPLAVQQRILHKKEARIKSEKNHKERLYYLNMAAFHGWDNKQQFIWVRDAILSCFKRAEALEESQQAGNILDAYQVEYLKGMKDVLLPSEDRVFNKIGRNINKELFHFVRKTLQKRANKAVEAKKLELGRPLSPAKKQSRPNSRSVSPTKGEDKAIEGVKLAGTTRYPHSFYSHRNTASI